jgi:mannose-6-phosphate isomerase-like protein (cupin superfamily)
MRNALVIVASLGLAGLGVRTMLAAPASPGVTYIAAAEVTAAFAKGKPLLEVDGYKIHASRREGPGQVEIHTRDTDVVYVLEGGAEVVTGGTVAGSHTIGTDEIRGTSIDGGTTTTLHKGDVMVIPNGTAHWFKTVQGPLLYYVVKVTAPAGGMK